MLSRVWSVLLWISAIAWFGNAALVVAGYDKFSSFTLFLSFVITGVVVVKWAMEAWENGER